VVSYQARTFYLLISHHALQVLRNVEQDLEADVDLSA